MLNNLIDRIKLPFRKEKELYFSLYKILGFYPRKITYYKVALMHKSLGHRATEEELKVLEGKKNKKIKGGKKNAAENRKGAKGLGKHLNNERLEFLGDAILDAVVGDIVYQRFPGKPEGFLTNTRSKLVQRETLGKLAKEMGISNLILASGRTSTHNSYIGGNAFEALVGAVYLDRGYEACQRFWIERVMEKYLNIDKVAYKEVNFKSKLLEWSQKNRVQIEFRLEDQSQDSHGSPTFVYTVVLEGVEGCKAEGFSKKESQQKASELTLKKLRSENKFLTSIFDAKTARTQMDEDPTVAVPEVEKQPQETMFRNEQSDAVEVKSQEAATVQEQKSETEHAIDALNLDDVSNAPKEKSKEDIIAEAEAAAYNS
ncbi:MAG: ribonuclease III [Prevotella sp.]|nr:ribonuclease III [Candidatus Prevotella equi]